MNLPEGLSYEEYLDCKENLLKKRPNLAYLPPEDLALLIFYHAFDYTQEECAQCFKMPQYKLSRKIKKIIKKCLKSASDSVVHSREI